MCSHQLFITVLLANCVIGNVSAYPLIARSGGWMDWDSSHITTSTPRSPACQTSAVSPSSTSAQTALQSSTSCLPCTSSTVNPSPSISLGNLIGIPQAGDVAILSNDFPLPQSDVERLAQHIRQDLELAGLGSDSDSNSSSGHLGQMLSSVPNGTSNGFNSANEELPASELSALFDVCFEDENCMFFNTTTSEVVDIFRYQATTNLTSYAENPWALLADAVTTQTSDQLVISLGVIFATNFTTAYTWGSPGMYLSFRSDGISASAPGILRLVDAYTRDP